MLKTILDRAMMVFLIGQLPLFIAAVLTRHPAVIIGAGACVVGIVAACAIGRICNVDGFADAPMAGPLLVVLACGAVLAIPSLARAEVDCWWSEIECRAGTECAWDDQFHSHRCLPVPDESAAAAMAPDAGHPLPVQQCAMQDEAACPTDYPHAYRACIREVRAHNATCAEQQTACEDARATSRIACMPEERGGTFDRRIPEAVAACGRARDAATLACPDPARAAPARRLRPMLDPVRCSIYIRGHSTCPP